MSLALTFSPAALSLFLLSYIIHAPSKSVKTVPAAPNAAVVIRAGKYLGASLSRKMLDLLSEELAYFTPHGVIHGNLRHQTHDIGARYSDGGQHDTPVFAGNIVIVPCIQDDRWRRCAPSHHETSKVGNMQLMGDINACVDDKADQRKDESEGDEWESKLCEIGCKTENKEHHGAGNVGRDRVQVGLDGAVAEALDNDGQIQLHTLQRNAEANLNSEDGPRGRVLEDLGRLAEVELFVDHRG